ncbi:LuxR family transcriptional regulator [Amycolatopsis suaedae]|uniref:LuxR family transcriptional regulator n=1 Tax=Amycolatopsis suaedae TaxID=2510978 RepID=A0A4Q7IZB0_9PSEU|nr:helix-turn-helix transcriptional regulator [Amycolatopsis suaedae]RZQ59819.1 LuxR family transcriptional regulator [Amycolatopsis suaedae]
MVNTQKPRRPQPQAVIVQPATWDSLVRWLESCGIALVKVPTVKENLPTYAMTPKSAIAGASRLAAKEAKLTDRELQVLVGMSVGQTNGEIGKGHHLSEDTVKSHARTLFRKLGARDRAQAVALGYQRGILLTAPSTS